MIAASRSQRVVGQTYYGLTDEQGHGHAGQPFVILRQVTYDDWIKDRGVELSEHEKSVIGDPATLFYYEVSVD